MPASPRQREFALEVAKKLREAGYESLWAGGCVRDQLLGVAPKDYDVATSATPDQIRDLFGRRRTIAIGAAFGVITVLGPREAGQIEVATFRSDAAYSDGRHPDSVQFTTAEHDAQRRDFTINGLFFDPIAAEVVDYVDGQADLNRRIIRAIGDARQRIGEDKLRMLRAVRFAATLGFEIDPATLAAIQELASEITSVSAERIGMEVRRMLVDANRATAIQLLREAKLLELVLPEVAELSPEAAAETARVLNALAALTLSLALATLLHRVTDVSVADSSAPPLTPRPSLLAPHSSLLAASIGRRLRYTNKEIERTAWLLANLPAVAVAAQLPWPRLQRLLTHEGAGEIVALREAIAGATDPAVILCRERLAWPAERLNPKPLVDGGDLIRHGLKPSPEFATLLEQIRDAQLNGEIHSPAEALALCDRLRGTPETLP